MTSKLSRALVLAAACSAAILTGCASGAPAPASTPPATTQTSAAAPAAGATSSAPPSNPANAAAATATAAAGPPECSAAQLKITYTDNSAIDNGALDGMSHHDSVIMFTNTGSGSCQTRGYPGVALLNANGQQVKQAVRTSLRPRLGAAHYPAPGSGRVGGPAGQLGLVHQFPQGLRRAGHRA